MSDEQKAFKALQDLVSPETIEITTDTKNKIFLDPVIVVGPGPLLIENCIFRKGLKFKAGIGNVYVKGNLIIGK